MATFYYSPDQNPPTPAAYILQASAAAPAGNKWYDPNRTWGEYWQQWENYFGYGKKPEQPTSPTKPILPTESDNLPYDHAFPFGVDPNDPSKPYAPHGFFCDEEGNATLIPIVAFYEECNLDFELQRCSDPTDPASPLNVYNVYSPMDPYNMQQFFYVAKPGSPWHQYERSLVLGRDLARYEGPGYRYFELDAEAEGGMIYDAIAKDTPENFPWLYDQDPSHHYRKNYSPFGTHALFTFAGPITDKVYLDSPVAPVGWQEVIPPANNAAQ